MYVAFAATLGLLWLERRSSLTPADHTIALLTIVLIFRGDMDVARGGG
jgi:hypothetical protein